MPSQISRWVGKSMISQTNTLSENSYGNSAPQTLSNLISLIQVKIKARANRKRMLEEILINKKNDRERMFEESKCNNIRKLYKTLVNLIDGRPPSYQYRGKSS